MRENGFTLIEILVYIAVLAALSVFGLLNLVNFRSGQDLDSDSKIIVSYLRDAQQRAISENSNSQWGVYFTNQVSGFDYYELFSGNSYVPANVAAKKTLHPSVEFVSASQEIDFSKLTGALTSPTDITITIRNAGSVCVAPPDPKCKAITVKSNGTITY